MGCGIRVKENRNQTDRTTGSLRDETGSVVVTQRSMEDEARGKWERWRGTRQDVRADKSETEEQWKRDRVVERRHEGPRTEEQGRWKQKGAIPRREGRGRRSESRLTPEEIQLAVAEIDHETLLRAKVCSEETRVEKRGEGTL